MDYLSYNGPENNKGGGRFYIAMAVMMLFFIILPYFMPQPEQPQEALDDKTASSSELVPVVVKYPIETRTLETDDYSLTMTNAGGARIESFHIKLPERYSEHGDFIRSQKNESNAVGGLLPLTMELKSFGINPETSFKTTSEDPNHKEIRFVYTDPDEKYQFEKIFTTTDKPYVVHTRLALTNRSSDLISDNLSIALFIRQIEGEEPGIFPPGSYVAAKCHSDGEMEYLDATDKDENEKFTKNLKWFAVDESYFVIAMSAEFANACELRNDNGILKSIMNVPVTMAPGTTTSYDFDMYVGPKESKYLANFGQERELDEIIDYGWIEVLAKPMAWILDKFHQWTGNWGLAIILLTLIVRVLLWPIAQKSQISMMRMSKIAPLMQEIQEKYKDDPATMQQKQLELYQQHQINPFGCLPLLLQMPIFFALYRCIFVTGGLYHAPFVLWIRDLSAPDPYFILPLLSVGLLVLQQLLTPTATKNKQQKIMMISMPILFGLMMLFLPSGLCLYMVISSTFSMAQSFYVRHLMAKEDDTAADSHDGKGVIDVQ